MHGTCNNLPFYNFIFVPFEAVTFFCVISFVIGLEGKSMRQDIG